ncbi:MULTISPECIES: GNAT family N-acetyltransferase [unclassified Actinopolyspora]|uniref:GNAT family N-acetyltransferase n=1 Tax=unclassified Actinopolyspora TaxID=2639451 RepID=UPI0013F5C16A|nr:MULTISPECIES: GNAT family N-acetyltransferase [unclassified Actinopolyspora]NHD17194.1 GNAT family N-acetyltransferase [Actinopolyspora sp. BKK2]NHE76346.1 GNAT family N-acetyltransferase [Actinopolyspora sp. BKK1]
MQQPSWTVRRATVDDVPAIARINVASWRSAYRNLVPEEALTELDSDEIARSYRELLASPVPERAILLARRADTIAAFSGVSPVRVPQRDAYPEHRTGELVSLYADPQWLGRGAGRAVHDAALGHLADHGFTRAVLWILEGNDHAADFYQRHGWTPDVVERHVELAGRLIPLRRWSHPLS